MIVAAVLVIGALALGWLAPLPLHGMSRRRVHPQLELTWWMALLVAVLASAVFGAVFLLLGDHPHLDHGWWQTCWVLIGHAHVHPLDELLGAGILAVLALVAARVAGAIRRRARAQRRAHRAHLAAVVPGAVHEVDGVLWLPHDVPFAYSIAGRPGLVVASTAVARMPMAHRDAVISHERQHLRGRHHWIVMAAEAMGDAMPRIPLFRLAARAARQLTELAADARAADVCGPTAVKAALVALAHYDEPLTMRLQRLDTTKTTSLFARLAACVTSSAAPPMLGAALLAALVTVVC